jgi:hypothetical protein
MPRRGLAIACAIAFATSACMRDQTRLMADTCAQVLQQDDPETKRRFLREAHARLQSERAASNPFPRFIRDTLDPGAQRHLPALRHCVAMLEAQLD